MNVLVLARDHEECTKLVAAAMGDHACDLVDVELDPLELELSGDEQDAEWRDVAEGLSADQPIWCQGTFYIYENDDDD